MEIVLNALLSVTSPAFENNGIIPLEYTYDGENFSPELRVANLPKETKSIAVIMDDPDAPSGTYVHWLLWNIPPREVIEKNSVEGIVGKNSKHETRYYGPCPPMAARHHYHFKVYALNDELNLDSNTYKEDLLKKMERHILGKGELIGVYKSHTE
ncbi:MAG: YbhB/YbcL family Raf kinase inhibitor-like protein [Bacteroidota bacterium]